MPRTSAVVAESWRPCPANLGNPARGFQAVRIWHGYSANHRAKRRLRLRARMQPRWRGLEQAPGPDTASDPNAWHETRAPVEHDDILEGQAMTALNDVKPGAMIRGVVPGHSVRIVSVDWIGNQAINLIYREPDGGVSETTLYRDDENRLGIETRGRSWSFDGDGNLLRLGHGSEPNRARASFRSLSRHSHQPGRSIAAPDLRRLWRDAGASAATLPARRRSGGGQDDHGRAADQGAACTGRSGALPDRGSWEISSSNGRTSSARSSVWSSTS